MNTEKGINDAEELKNKINEAKIHSDIMGSDHCPIELEIEL